MLLRAVPERVLGALFGSELVAETLYRHLTVSTSVQTPRDLAVALNNLRKQLTIAVLADVDQRTGRRHRTNEIEAIAQKLYPTNFLETKQFPLLDAVFEELMEWRGSAVYFIPEHVQRYAELVSELDPTVLVAWRLAKSTDCTILRTTVAQTRTLFVGPLFFDVPYADNHSHLGGISGDDAVLSELVLFNQISNRNEIENGLNSEAADIREDDLSAQSNMRRLNRVRRMLSAFVGLWKDVANDETAALAQHEMSLLDACRQDAKSIVECPTIDWPTENAGIVVASEIATNRWMLKEMAGAASGHDLQPAWIWLFMLLWRTYSSQEASTTVRSAVLLFITDVMVLRRQLIMDGQGLRRFTTGYPFSELRVAASKSKSWKQLSHREAARRTFARLGDKAELKISAGNFGEADPLTGQFAQIANERFHFMRAQSDEQAASSTALSHLDHWHFCLHFNRSGKKGRYVRRQKLWEEARLLKNVLSSKAKWNLGPLLQGSEGELNDQRSPAHFVRALDVAGDETKWPIEVFAPMLRWVRHRELVKDIMGSSYVPPTKLHLSIHAGEDYAHPLSGLRHVDETVLFSEMIQGDRIGHGLALGIPPFEWFRRHGDVLLPVEEHVDNLIWAWKQAKDLVQIAKLDVAKSVLPRLEERIKRFLPYISWLTKSKEMGEPKLQDLYKAWEYRINCPTLILEQPKSLQIGSSNLPIGAPDYYILCASMLNPETNDAAGLYVQRAIAERDASKISGKPILTVRLTYPRHGYPSRAQLQLEKSGPNNASQLHDHDDKDDLTLMSALQDWCIERYAQAGIAIETNPSSNVYIGQVETHSDHPIYRWYPPNIRDMDKGGKYNEFGLRTMRIPVTINTDDQGIIPTTLRMEYHLMHEAALDHGHPEPLAEDWIKDLRERGVQTFTDAHESKEII